MLRVGGVLCSSWGVSLSREPPKMVGFLWFLVKLAKKGALYKRQTHWSKIGEVSVPVALNQIFFDCELQAWLSPHNIKHSRYTAHTVQCQMYICNCICTCKQAAVVRKDKGSHFQSFPHTTQASALASVSLRFRRSR